MEPTSLQFQSHTQYLLRTIQICGMNVNAIVIVQHLSRAVTYIDGSIEVLSVEIIS